MEKLVKEYDMDKIFEAFKPLEELNKITARPAKATMFLELAGMEEKVLRNILRDWAEGRSYNSGVHGYFEQEIESLKRKLMV